MYYFFYEDTDFESGVFNTFESAEAAWPKIEREVAEQFGYCDPDRLFMAECEED
jgi:hypothetical protein